MNAAALAAARFGVGPRPGEVAAIAGDPRGWVAAQIAPPRPIAAPDLPTTAEAGRRTLAARATPGDPAAQRAAREALRNAYRADALAQLRAAIAATAPFAERMAWFWTNHFTVSLQRPIVAALVGPFAREAIRPRVFGRFADLLVAATRHPAMLLYLDNAVSIGPGSPAGLRRARGLNENLAREILELHTLGVGNYGQDDVRQLALALTGWTIARAGDPDAGAYRFARLLHEPGPRTLLGQRLAGDGEEEGVAALTALARHPATARHVATRLARHFAADDPPPALVDRLARAYRDSDGDLAAVARSLATAPEPWATPLAKVRTPFELVVAAERLVAPDRPPGRVLADLRRLGQLPHAAPSPQGWPDTASAWIGPEALLRRIEWAAGFAGAVGGARDVPALLEDGLGVLAGAATRMAVRRAGSAEDALVLLLASAEFQRR
ncbi:MAG: DUF1800 domain-containing protein [Alphaproteobacteria bacterium]|nr:DUF1800 domain-containing protein [Alphaproteobacteria bacterium]